MVALVLGSDFGEVGTDGLGVVRLVNLTGSPCTTLCALIHVLLDVEGAGGRDATVTVHTGGGSVMGGHTDTTGPLTVGAAHIAVDVRGS